MDMTLVRKMVAEGLGVFFLVAIGCGAIMAGSPYVPFAFGIGLGVAITAVAHISGAHFNPAISLALAATGHLKWMEVPFYIVAQLVGAVLAAIVVNVLYGGIAPAVNAPAAGLDASLPFLAEVIMTAMLSFVIHAVATDDKSAGKAYAPLAIGFTVLVCALWGGAISSASLNPARSFGPALIAGDLSSMFLFTLAPIIGALVGGFIYEFLRGKKA